MMEPSCHACGTNFSKVLFIVALHSIHTRALTFESLCQALLGTLSLKVLSLATLYSEETGALTCENVCQYVRMYV